MNEISGPSMLDGRGATATTHILTALPPPPTKPHRSTSIHKQHSLGVENELHASSQSQSQPISLIIVPGKNLDSSCSSPTEITTSPRTSLVTGDKSWSIFSKDGHSSWTNFEEHHHLLGNDEDSSERHSSDDDFDVWSINEEQREYYTNQFKSMQPDLKKKITGANAKEFFEKSKLSLAELSKIWQLSDVDKDGALTLEEFSTAMHLVVLRRNNIELPDILPPSLVPKIHKKTSEADVNAISVVPQVQQIVPLPQNVPVSQIVPLPQNVPVSQIIPLPQNVLPPQNVPPAQNVHSPKQTSPSDLTSPQSKEWTKFNDSPTSSLSSPGMKPVNFDFSAASVEQDPKILHPVALRLSPERQPPKELITTVEEQVKTNQIKVHRPIPRKPLGPSLSNATKPQNTESNIDSVTVHPHSNSFSGLTDSTKANQIPSSSQVPVGLPQGPKKEPPPPPPPRPKHNHIRSSSLDLNKLGKTVPYFLGTPPAVPPRISPSTGAPRKVSHGEDQANSEETGFANFDGANFDDCDSNNLHLKSGAFEIYKKPLLAQDGSSLNMAIGSSSFLLDQTSTPSGVTDDSTALLVDISNPEFTDRRHFPAMQPLAIVAANITSVPRDKKELQAAIQAHRERNMMLSLLNNELNQELSEVMEERIALEVQLEHLKPFS